RRERVRRRRRRAGRRRSRRGRVVTPAPCAEDLVVLGLLARLRLAPPHVLAALADLGASTRAHARLAPLRDRRVGAAARPRGPPRRARALARLPDAGAAARAAAGGVDSGDLLRRHGLGAAPLRALALRLGPHLGCCALLALLAGARRGRPRLTTWAE